MVFLHLPSHLIATPKNHSFSTAEREILRAGPHLEDLPGAHVGIERLGDENAVIHRWMRWSCVALVRRLRRGLRYSIMSDC